MNGIVTILDDAHYRRVEAIWAELAGRFDVHGIYVTPFPHFSYQIAEHYDIERITSTLQRLAGQTAPFQVHTSGLGIFTAARKPRPVLYIPVARSPLLAALQAEIWTAVTPAAAGAVDYYNPVRWIPHITLGSDDITPEKLPAVVDWLTWQPLNWILPVDNFSLILDDGQGQTLSYRFPFE